MTFEFIVAKFSVIMESFNGFLVIAFTHFYEGEEWCGEEDNVHL